MDKPWNRSQRIGLKNSALSFPESFQRHRNILAMSPRKVTNGKPETLHKQFCTAKRALPQHELRSGYNSALRLLENNCSRSLQPFCHLMLFTATALEPDEQNPIHFRSSYMRVILVTFALLCALVAGAAAQQTNSSNDEPKQKEKKTKTNEPAARNAERKPGEKPSEVNPAASPNEEPKPPAPKPGADKDKEEFDVAEVPPVVTHHCITLYG